MNVTDKLLTANVRKGRESRFGVDVVVVHVMEGTMAGTLEHFNHEPTDASAHYGISRTGEIVRYVDEDDTAFHAGVVDRPSAPIIIERKGHNPNSFSIGIEHEGTGREELTAAQRTASVELIRDICKRRNIPMTRRHILAHREIRASKSCPGKIDVDALVRDVAGVVATPTLVDRTPRVVYSSYFNDYLLVTRVVSDTEWYFVPLKTLSGAGMRAQTALSQMPTRKP